MTPTQYQIEAANTDLKTYKQETHVRNRFNTTRAVKLLHYSLGMTTETAEFADALKKHLMYGKLLDETNLKEELGDLLWYVSRALTELDTDFETVMAINIAKLKARYPDKFTEVSALNRNLDVERKVLET